MDLLDVKACQLVIIVIICISVQSDFPLSNVDFINFNEGDIYHH